MWVGLNPACERGENGMAARRSCSAVAQNVKRLHPPFAVPCSSTQSAKSNPKEINPMANTSKRGFASMDPAKQREIASKGGRAAHAKGTAHEFTADEARLAGRKGGHAVSRDR